MFCVGQHRSKQTRCEYSGNRASPMKSPLLLLLLLATLTIALCQTASSQPATPSPALYHARVEVEVRPPKDEDAVRFVRKYLPEDAAITVTQLRATPPSVTI